MAWLLGRDIFGQADNEQLSMFRAMGGGLGAARIKKGKYDLVKYRACLFAGAPPSYLHKGGVTEHAAKSFKLKTYQFWKLNLRALRKVNAAKRAMKASTGGELRQTAGGHLVHCPPVGTKIEAWERHKVDPIFVESCITFQHLQINVDFFKYHANCNEVPDSLKDSVRGSDIPFTAPFIRLNESVSGLVVAGWCKVDLPGVVAQLV